MDMFNLKSRMSDWRLTKHAIVKLKMYIHSVVLKGSLKSRYSKHDNYDKDSERMFIPSSDILVAQLFIFCHSVLLKDCVKEDYLRSIKMCAKLCCIDNASLM